MKIVTDFPESFLYGDKKLQKLNEITNDNIHLNSKISDQITTQKYSNTGSSNIELDIFEHVQIVDNKNISIFGEFSLFFETMNNYEKMMTIELKSTDLISVSCWYSRQTVLKPGESIFLSK